ncbi:molybdopterin-binding protein [Limisalsivibrio acetivorans]|uniref:molybdopterin-binding protein n=1 Tax=Limisalsivibrio acetivorans TaxID=1304888 RepID=UPI0003B4136F|nr:molybdopterin-binding protein [Limisalsivibrio acetivorans]
MRKISVDESVGETLAYDITEVSLEKNIKRRAFKRGHLITDDDIPFLKNLGRRNIFVADGDDTDVHEDDAARITAPLAAGENVSYDAESSEGKVNFYAEVDGVFHVDRDRLYEINSLEIPSMPTIHDCFPVKKGDAVAAFRIIPLTCDKSVMDSIEDILSEPILSVNPYKLKTAGILVTGNEVYEGRIKDAFIPKLTTKLKAWNIEVKATSIAPDDEDFIVRELSWMLEECDFILTTGGTSVDPDDITADALRKAGVKLLSRGNPIQPGNNLDIGYAKGKPVLSVPAAALFFHATALDIFLPRILAEEEITKENIASMGHGGLCLFCKTCHFPVCPFGRGAL